MLKAVLVTRSVSSYCNVMYCTVLYCTVLYCTVLYCTVAMIMTVTVGSTSEIEIQMETRKGGGVSVM
jgi:hypothetical protein